MDSFIDIYGQYHFTWNRKMQNRLYAKPFTISFELAVDTWFSKESF